MNDFTSTIARVTSELTDLLGADKVHSSGRDYEGARQRIFNAGEEHGLAAATGTMGRVGVAGLTLGGYGPLTGRLGLALDNLLGAEVVLADGRVVWTDAESEPDLFWALRGGGGNFGVVTSMRIQMHALPSISTGIVAFPLDQAADVISGYGALVEDFPEELTETPAFVQNPDGSLVLAMLHSWCGDEAEDGRVRDLVADLGDAVESTAFGIRRRHVMIGFYALWREGDEAENRAWADAGEAALQDHALPSAYPNYFGADRPDQAAVAYGANAGRLLELKARYDPDHVFSATSLPAPDSIAGP